MAINNSKIGIALSGGGARGIAHIGVLKALEENGISPHSVAGTSFGAIVGGLYSAGKTPDEMLHIAKETDLLDVFRPNFIRGGLVDISSIRTVLAEQILEDNFKHLKRNLFVCVSSLHSGKWKIVQRGNLFEAIHASAAIPLLFKPVTIDNKTYVDGGLLNNLPIEPLRVDCDIVIGVNVVSNQKENDFNRLWSIGRRCFNLIVWKNTEPRLKQCDIVIDLGKAIEQESFEFRKVDEIFLAGYLATLKQMPQILTFFNQIN